MRKIKEKKIREKKKLNIYIVLIIFFASIFFATTLVSLARYVYNVVYEHYLESKDFYFSSDILNINHGEYELTNNWDGSQTKRIPVNMFSKRNDKAYTASDITYTIRCESSPNVVAVPTKNSGTIYGTDTMTIAQGAGLDYFEVVVNPANNQALGGGVRAWVDIYATANSPYAQELSGRIIIRTRGNNITYEIVDAVNSPYLTVNVTNAGAETAAITLSYSPSVVLIDMTSRFYLNSNSASNVTQQINGYAYLNSVTSNLASNGKFSVKFYKQDKRQNYSYSGTGTPIITLTYH